MLLLLIPWLLLFLVSIAIVLLIKKKRIISVCLVLTAIILNWWSNCFCVGFKRDFTGDLKVLSFNVSGTPGPAGYDKKRVDAIIALVKEESPDVLFLTENFDAFGDSVNHLLKKQYPYSTRNLMPHNAIYSKTPISDEKEIDRFNNGTAFIATCTVSIKGKSLRIVGCHLSSNNYSSNLDYQTPSDINSFSDVKNYLSNIERASELRRKEIDEALNFVSENERVIVMGDMNDLCSSTTLRKLEIVGFKNTWSVGGFGYGATIHHPLPYRIDHIYYNDGFLLKGIKKHSMSGTSDHDALVAIFDLL
jgi:endonuclease/exonuclease/phosphatase (EEP) superfamily protein YafD